MRKTLIFNLIFAGLFIGGCANTSEVLSAKSYSSSIADKWMIHADSVEPEHREIWEKACLQQWQKLGLSAVSARQYWQDSGAQSALLRATQEAGFDQLIILDTKALLLSKHSPSQPEVNTIEKEIGSANNEKIKTYLDQTDNTLPEQRINVDIYPLTNTNNKPLHLTITSHEANQLHKIARSQCQALVKFIHTGQHN